MNGESRRRRNKRRSRLRKQYRSEWRARLGWHDRLSVQAWRLNHPREMALFLGANSIYGKRASIASINPPPPGHEVIYQDSDSVVTQEIKKKL